MQISQVPALLPKAFAASGTKNTIPVDSQISVTPGAASLTDGFPSLTMTPLAAGGVPPYGADTNGILNWLSQICQWSNAGGVYPYNAAFSTAIGGYPKGALIQKASGVGYWVSSSDNNTTDPDTGGAGWVGFDPSTLQAGSYTSAVDSGSLNALAVTLTPAPTALSAGMQVTTMNVVATNTGAATLNLNGLGAKPIVLPSGAALSGGEIYAGSAATFVYTGASWMLQTRQPATGVPSMTFAQVAALTSNQGPIICSDEGGAVYVWTGSAYAPLMGSTTYAGSVKLATTAQAQSMTDTTAALTASNLADAFKGSAQSLTSNGYQKLPGGLIIQWGSVNAVPSGSGSNITFPIAFPNTILNASATVNNTGGNSGASAAGVGALTKSSMTVFNNGNTGATAVSWIALGY